MAGERKGKTYEAVVFAALTELVAEGAILGPLHWNERPAKMTIEPDFTFGPVDSPTRVLLLTYCGSPRNSDMKCWRNLGELVEAKTSLGAVPTVAAITFGEIKEDLAPIQNAAFDGFSWVTTRQPLKYRGRHEWLCRESWVAELDIWIESLSPGLPKKALHRQWILELVAGLNVATRKTCGFEALKLHLKGLWAGEHDRLDGVWTALRTRALPRAPGQSISFFKRGFGKLYLLGDKACAEALAGKTEWTAGQLPAGAVQLGILVPNTAGTMRLVDKEALHLAELGGAGGLLALRDFRPPRGVKQLRAQSLAVSELAAMIDVVFDRHATLSTAQGFLDALTGQHRDANHLNAGRLIASEDVWLFRVASEVVRVHLGNKRQSFGYAKLLKEAKVALRAGPLPAWLLAKFGDDGASFGRAAEPIRRGLQDYLNRTTKKTLSMVQLGIVAWVLAEKLRAVPPKDRASIKAKSIDGWKGSVFEARYLCHRYLDPVGYLIERLVPGFSHVKIDNCFAQAAGCATQAGRMEVGQAKSTIINWQSASDEGRDHKKKELCGRAVALRFEWDSAKKSFAPRRGVSRLLLVLDGTWTQADIKALLHAGWDDVFYPYELDRLVKAIV